MNVHDSERLTGLLEEAGYVPAALRPDSQADVVVFNTCAVRENADNKLYGNLGHLAPVKAKYPGMQIAVGGASPRRTAARSPARRRGSTSCSAPTTSAPSRPCSSARGSTTSPRWRSSSRSRSFPSDAADVRRESPYAAWVSVSVGCDNTARSRIVPACAGPRCRPPRGKSSRRSSAGRGGRGEVTLLGQNVSVRCEPSATAQRSRAAASGRLVEGIDAAGFTSPHPHSTDDVIAGVTRCSPPAAPPAPPQLGSDAVLKAMPLVPQRAIPRHHRPGRLLSCTRRYYHRHHR